MKIPQTKRYSIYKNLVILEEDRRLKEEGKSKKLDFTSDNRKHYVYRVTDYTRNIEEHYYGSRSTPKKNPKRDITDDFWSYRTSSKHNTILLENKENYKVKIIKVFNNTADKMIYEAFLHQYFDIKRHNNFWNKSNQTSFGFDTTGEKRSKELSLKTGSAMRGKKHTLETKEKIRVKSTGRWHSEEAKKKIGEAHKGKIFSEEHKKKIGLASMGRTHSKGMKHTDEAKKKISDARKASKGTYKMPIVKCPYCKKEGGSNNMKRWHFDNCKIK